ncbi:MAG: DUF6430 domain-containing protein [Saccharofermentans sp.]|nr:DUF6430 domain-containing protein [Saccharofermentans sp.]
MLKSLKYNWKYIYSTSNKIATIVFSLWGFITLVTPTDGMLNSIENWIVRILIAILILAFIYVTIIVTVTIYSNRKKEIKVFNLHSNHSLYVKYGDLFNCGVPDERKNIAFAGNRCFDTIVDDDLVGSSKIHGIALNRIYANGERNQETVNREIQKNLSLHGYKKETIGKTDKRSGNLLRYELGSVAEINGLQNEKYFVLGLTYFDKELRAHVDVDDYIKAINSLIKYISDRSQGFPVYMPVIGTGGADAGYVNDLIVFMIKTIELYKDKIDCDVYIVVSEKEEKLGLMNIKML